MALTINFSNTSRDFCLLPDRHTFPRKFMDALYFKNVPLEYHINLET